MSSRQIQLDEQSSTRGYLVQRNMSSSSSSAAPSSNDNTNRRRSTGTQNRREEERGQHPEHPRAAAQRRSDEDEVAESSLLFGGYNSDELNDVMEAERDVLGTRTVAQVPKVPPHVLAKAHEGLDQALAGLAPSARAAYDEARRQNPRVVALESPPARFLLASEYNYWTAAQRLARYWEARRDIFGPEQYTRPLTLRSNHTALSPRTLEIIQNGALVLVGRDRYHRPACMFDCDREDAKTYPGWHDPQVRIQMVFYFCQVLSESDLAAVNGVVFLVACKSSGVCVLRPYPASVRLVLSGALPIRVSLVHFAQLKRPNFFRQAINLWLDCLKRFSSMKLRMRVHFGETPQELMKLLREYGWSEPHIPPRLGGTASFQSWYDERVQLEQERYAFLDEDTMISRGSSVAAAVTEHASTQPEDNQEEEQKQNDLKRKMDDFRVWAQDHLEGQKIAKLKSTLSPLQEQNAMLKRRSEFLKAQVACALYVAQQYDADQIRIEESLTNLASTFPGIERDLGLEDQLQHDNMTVPQQSFGEALLTRLTAFLGRAPFTGEWMFTQTPWLSPYQQHILHGVKQCVRKEHDQEEEAIAQQARGASLSETPRHAEEEEDDDELDRQIQILREQKNRLKLQSKALQRRNSFLQSSSVSCTYMSHEFDDFTKRHQSMLTEFYESCFAALTGQSALDLEENASSSPSIMAYRILQSFTNWDGAQFVNDAVTLAQHHKDHCAADGNQESSSFLEASDRMDKKSSVIHLAQTNHAAADVLALLLTGADSPWNQQLMQALRQGASPREQVLRIIQGAASITSSPLADPKERDNEAKRAQEEQEAEQEEKRRAEARRRQYQLQRKKLLKRL